MKCPYCGCEAEFPEVDIGVGSIQCGPAGCGYCLSYQMSPDEDRSKATEEERRTGWWKGGA